MIFALNAVRLRLAPIIVFLGISIHKNLWKKCFDGNELLGNTIGRSEQNNPNKQKIKYLRELS